MYKRQDRNTLDLRLLKEFEKSKNKSLKNALSNVLINSMVELVLKYSSIDGETIVNQLKKADRLLLVEIIKNLKFNFKSLRPLSEAIVTTGGIDVKEVDSSTMESKKIKNLYIVGELLDVDANTGGYNLTIAFATGHLAGVSCLRKEE